MSCAEPGGRTPHFPLETRAARTPDAPALIWRPDEGPIAASPGAGEGAGGTHAPAPLQMTTFGELDRLTAAIASNLRDRGIARGERVALRLAQDGTYPALLWSLLRSGAVAVPLSTRLPESVVPGLLRSVDCHRLVVGSAGHAAAGVELIAAAELLAADARGDLPAFDRGAPATIVFTSGSAGAPKAALHSFENHWASAVGANRNLPLRPGDRWLLSLPLWHVGGIAVLFRCLCAGAAVAVPGRQEPLADAIPELGATHLSLVATQLSRLLRDERGRAALGRLKAVLLGGGPAHDALVAAATRAGVGLVTSYGSTETSSQATATAPGDPPEALRTAGRPLAFRELRSSPDGEIIVRGRTLFRGYVEGGAIRDARDADGWFHTGDRGRLDHDGRLIVQGRLDTMFISGGENIHPEEIEREILRVPGLLEAIVVPVPDAEFGARPAAFLRTTDGALPDAAALGRFLRETLPGFKVPARLFAWPDLPGGMKPDRRALAALARDAGRPAP